MTDVLSAWAKQSEKRRVSSYAVPGVGECLICMEIVPNVKVLDCDHTLCVPCTQKMIAQADNSKMLCPQCRAPTDVSHGLDDLPTRYFGKIRCDLCLDKKPTDDMWWCGECVYALCSKCNIIEHASKEHRITEWNKGDQVKFSVDCINSMERQRHQSTDTDLNRQIVKKFLEQVEHELLHRLHNRSDLSTIRNQLIHRYGARFSSDSDQSSTSNQLASIEEAPKTIARVLQLAGESISDAAIPSFHDQAFQVYFGLTPAEVAAYLKNRIEFIPLENTREVPQTKIEPGGRQESPFKQPTAPNASTSNSSTPKQSSAEPITLPTNVKLLTRKTPDAPVLNVDLSAEQHRAVVHLPAAVEIYDTSSDHVHVIPISKQSRTIRSATIWHQTDHQLVLALQSTVRTYEWYIEVWNIAHLPASHTYTAQLDIDPEDKVDNLRIYAHELYLYEMRICSQNISEIQCAQVVKKDKKGKVRLKEQLVYEKGESRITAIRVINVGKERHLIVWDELSSCVYRLIINKDGRCELQSTILHSVDPVPFTLNADLHLYVFDQHLQRVCVSQQAVANRMGITLKQLFTHKNTVRCIRVRADGTVLLLTLSKHEIHIVLVDRIDTLTGKMK